MFSRLTFGGPLLGLLLAIATTFLLSKVFKIPLLQVVLVFISPYLLFYTSENTPLKISGVLALCTLGLFMSDFGKTRISSESDHAVHYFWSFIGFCGETLIFLLAGCIIGKKIAIINITYIDWIMIIPFYILLHLIRGAVILIFYPIFTKLGYGLSWKEALVLTYSGLRGAVALVMALRIFKDNTMPIEMRDKVLLFTCAIAGLTILINGTTTSKLLEILGLNKENSSQIRIYNQIVEHLMEAADDNIENSLKGNRFLNVVDWRKVKETSFTPEYQQKIKKIDPMKKNQITNFEGALVEEMSGYHIEDNEELTNECRQRFIILLKGVYWEEFEKGFIKGSDALKLIETAENSQDDSEKELNDWEDINDDIKPGLFSKLIYQVGQFAYFRKFTQKYFLREVCSFYDIVSTFITSHETAEERLKEFDFPDEIFKRISVENKANIEKANNFLKENIFKDYENLVKSIQIYKGAYSVLHSQKNTLNEIYESGCLKENDFMRIRKALDHAMDDLTIELPESDEMNPSYVIPNINFFKNHFFDDHIKEIIDSATLNYYENEGCIVKEGESMSSIYIVMKGSVVVENANFKRKYYYGEVIGLPYILHRGGSLAKLTAEGFCCLAKISTDYLSKMIQGGDERENIWRSVVGDYIMMDLDSFEPFKRASNEKIEQIFKFCLYAEYKEGDVVDLSLGGLLLQGSLTPKNSRKNEQNYTVFRALRYLKWEGKTTATEDTSVFHFTEGVAQILANISMKKNMLVSNNIIAKNVIKKFSMILHDKEVRNNIIKRDRITSVAVSKPKDYDEDEKHAISKSKFLSPYTNDMNKKKTLTEFFD